MDHIAKFIRRLSPKDRKRVRAAYVCILKNRLNELDVKPLTGKRGWFRCRVGNIRIIFTRVQSKVNIISEVNWRGQVYKNK